MSADTSSGARFAQALVAKDFERVATLLDPEVDFRALTPNQCWRARGPEEVITEVLRRWIDDDVEFEL